MQNQKQVKRFVAPSMTRALDLVRQELGPEAVILSSQRTKQGVEIVTSVEPDLATSSLEQSREFGRHFDNELDTAMQSDSAWKQQAVVEKAAQKYEGHLQVNSDKNLQVNSDKDLECHPGQRLNGEKLAREIEKARERMLAAKRKEKYQQQAAPTVTSAAGPGSPAPQHLQSDFNYPEGLADSTGAAQMEPARDGPITAAVTGQEPQIAGNSQEAERALAREAAARAAADQELAALRAEKQLSAQHEASRQQDQQKLAGLQSEIADLRMLLEQQVWRMSDNMPAQTRYPGQIQLTPHYAMLSQRLTRLGLAKELAHELIQQVGTIERVSDAWQLCMAELAQRLPVLEGDIIDGGGVFAFVGPTGVGKTTTIAKLAARYALQHGPGKVALITTDTYRVGAYDQLRSLGRILNMPVRAVDDEHSLLGLITALRNFPLILIDTAGFRHGDPMLHDQLTQLDACHAVRRFLVLSCNSQVQSLTASTHAYASKRAIDGCVLTKVDESASLGEAIGVVLKKQIPLAYTTDGQEIPKDIAAGCGRKLVAAAINIMKNKACDEIGVAGA